MKINIKTKDLYATQSLYKYIDDKLGSLTKFLKHFEAEGVDELTLTISRTTEHHNKGQVFEAKAELRLPKRNLRATEKSDDIRKAIDSVKSKIQLEIKKYKTQYLEPNSKKK